MNFKEDGVETKRMILIPNTAAMRPTANACSTAGR